MTNYEELKVGDYTIRIRPTEGGIHSGMRKISKVGGEREPELLYVLRKEIHKGMKNQLIARLAHLGDLSVKQKAAVMGVAPRTWQDYLTAYHKQIKKASIITKGSRSRG